MKKIYSELKEKEYKRLTVEYTFDPDDRPKGRENCRPRESTETNCLVDFLWYIHM